MPTAAYRKRVNRFAPLKVADPNSSSGTSGVATVFSTNRKRTSDPTPTIKLPRTRGSVQPRIDDSRNPYTSAAKPRVTIAAPNQSRLLVSELRDSGTRHNEIIRTTAAKGRLIKNTQCQEACSTSHPPRTGPSAVVIVVKPAQVPIALPRDFSSKDELMMARLPGTRNAAAIPWTERHTNRFLMLDEKPQPAEATAKPTTPSKNMDRRP